MPDPSREELLQLSDQDLVALDWKSAWRAKARIKQLAPPGDWSYWMALAGRGWGKTETGGHWLAEGALADPGSFNHVIAPTSNDVRMTCFEGHTGLLSHIPDALIEDYNKSLHIITLVNGAVIRGFSAQEPERLRGPQCHRLWFDELAATDRATLDESWKMAMFGLRLGSHPQAMITTTPKPVELLRDLMRDPKCVVTRGTTYENRDNLSDSFFRAVAQYEGTVIGRQELHGEMIDPEEAGIVKRSQIRLWPRGKPLPPFHFIIMSLDTAFSERTVDKKTYEPDPTACTVWGLFRATGEEKPGVLLLDAWGEHLSFPDLVKRTRAELKSRYGTADTPIIRPLIGVPRINNEGKMVDLLVIEDKGSGISLRQQLEREGIPAYKYNPGHADKLQRLHMVSHLFQSGYIWMVESDHHSGKVKTWAEPVLEQLCAFAGSGSIRHDDYVDSTTQALRVIIEKWLGSILDPAFNNKKEDPLTKVVRLRPRGSPYAI